jgi:hypothetical protein
MLYAPLMHFIVHLAGRGLGIMHHLSFLCRLQLQVAPVAPIRVSSHHRSKTHRLDPLQLELKARRWLLDLPPAFLEWHIPA